MNDKIKIFKICYTKDATLYFFSIILFFAI